MNRIFALLPILFSVYSFAQTCKPDNTISGDENGVFPMPYHAVSNPEGGIDKEACLNSYYEFVVTTVVGDSFRLGNIARPMDSLTIPIKNGVSGLPDGISCACNPPNCNFSPGTKGCVLLYGTPDNAAQVGEHELKIKGTLYITDVQPLELVFPNDLIAPGSYKLKVVSPGSSGCTSSVKEVKEEWEIARQGDRFFIQDQAHAVLSAYDLNGRFLLLGKGSLDMSFGKGRIVILQVTLDDGQPIRRLVRI